MAWRVISLFKMKQLELGLRRWGGKRKGAGRKGSGITSVPHRARPEHKERYPVHVTWRGVRGLPSLRSFALAREVGETIARINDIHDGGAGAFRIVHFSIQPNHLHLIVEGADKVSLMKGLKGLAIQMARRINRAAGTRGRVIAERYHARVLRHPRQVRNCISYVLHNHKHHRTS